MLLPDLPVTGVLPELLETLAEGHNAVLVAPPGAGKTTLIPLVLLEAEWLGRNKIIMLEPRRLAARAAARRMAFLLGEEVGESVGYRVRMDSKISAKTRIEVVTEGVFTRMILDDPELLGVAVILFDEFHERSLDGDLGLALALDAQRGLREDLRLIAMSATIDGARAATLLDCSIIESDGRSFPIEICYHDRPTASRLEDFVAGEILLALKNHTGSLLVFLPGQGEIERIVERLCGKTGNHVDIAPLYGALEGGRQDLAIRPAQDGRRKVVLATSIAETSLTIEGITVIIDCGLARLPQFEPSNGLTRLITVRASKASIDQRAGRAGRTAPGIAIRLWRKEQTAALPSHTPPEILAADLTHLLLDLASWGVQDPAQLSWLDEPPGPALKEARMLLQELNALDPSGHLTPHGETIRNLSLPPRIGHMVIKAAKTGCEFEAAFLSVLLGERGLGGQSADLEQRMMQAKAEKGQRAKSAMALARRIADNARSRVLEKMAVEKLSIGALLSLAWPDRIAQRAGQSRSGAIRYRVANGSGAELGADDALARSPWLVIADVAGRAGAARIVSAASITLKEIEFLHQGRIVENEVFGFNTSTNKISAKKLRMLGALKLAETAIAKPSEKLVARAILDAVRKHGLSLLGWSDAKNSLRKRLEFLHAQNPDLWPDVSDKALLKRLDDWLAPFLFGKTGLDAISANDLDNGLKHLVPWNQQAEIDQLAPRHYTTPAGSKTALRYDQDSVVVSAKVQEFYGYNQHPSIDHDRMPLLVELLSPAQRPVQLTRDLPGFWRGSWRDVRSDMRARYPKHYWPEAPLEAEPMTGSRRRKGDQ